MRLILVRHGRPDEEDAFSPHDPPLNADGRRQARSVADWLAGEGVTRIVASPLRRAQQTAVPLAERLGLSIDTIDGWAEADRATMRYRSTETLRAEGGEAWARFVADPIRYLGAEPEEFRAGVLAALQATAPQADRARARRRLHARTSHQHHALACAWPRPDYEFPSGLRLDHTSPSTRGRRPRRRQRQRDRLPSHGARSSSWMNERRLGMAPTSPTCWASPRRSQGVSVAAWARSTSTDASTAASCSDRRSRPRR